MSGRKFISLDEKHIGSLVMFVIFMILPIIPILIWATDNNIGYCMTRGVCNNPNYIYIYSVSWVFVFLGMLLFYLVVGKNESVYFIKSIVLLLGLLWVFSFVVLFLAAHAPMGLHIIFKEIIPFFVSSYYLTLVSIFSCLGIMAVSLSDFSLKNVTTIRYKKCAFIVYMFIVFLITNYFLFYKFS